MGIALEDVPTASVLQRGAEVDHQSVKRGEYGITLALRFWRAGGGALVRGSVYMASL